MADNYTLPLLAELEADALHVLREAAAELERPALARAGTQESACLARLVEAAFAPGAAPFADSGAAQISSERSLEQPHGLWGHLDNAKARVFPLADWTPADVQRYLSGPRDLAPQPELLRLVVVGGEGAGKSTLSARLGQHATSPRRRLVITDAGQSTRSLAAAASTAEVAVIVIDAGQGVSRQARRHAFLCSLLGVPRLLVAAWQKHEEVRAEFESFAARLSFKSIDFVALHGDDLAPLLAQLDKLYTGADRNLVDLRFQVQAVTRADGARWYLGRVASGVVKPGDEVVLLPAHRRTRVRAVRLGERALDYAYAPLSVAVSLEEDVEAGRGAVIAHARNLPHGVRALDSMVVWMDAEPLAAGRVYLLKHGAAWVRASCAEVTYRFDAESLHRTSGDRLGADDTGRASFTLFEERFVDAYAQNRGAGGFIIADAETRRTLGAGMIVDRESEPARVERGRAAKRVIVPHQSKVTTADRARLLEQSAVTLWLTGLSGSGKSTLATELERHLVESGRACYMLDGDNVRAGINRDLGFGPDDRRENIRRISEVARLMNDAGLIVVTAFISPYRADRDMARTIIGAERFVEVFVDASLQVCESRDPKGLYRKARKGEIPEFTGISAPYEPPEAPALTLDTAASPIGKCVDDLLALVLSRARH